MPHEMKASAGAGVEKVSTKLLELLTIENVVFQLGKIIN